MRLLALVPLALLAACAAEPKTIIKRVPVEVKVPVAAPCMGERPPEVEPLRNNFTREEWTALTTDQRENLLAAQAIMRMLYGEKLADASAGCR